MENNNKQLIEKAYKELFRLDEKYASYRSKFFRDNEILGEIIMNVCSYPENSEEGKYWGVVRDLYDKCYKP